VRRANDGVILSFARSFAVLLRLPFYRNNNDKSDEKRLSFLGKFESKFALYALQI